MSIASLEAEVSRLESINRELQSELSEIERSARRSADALDDLCRNAQQKLNDSTDQLIQSRNKGLAAIEMQAEIDRMYVRFKQMELANKKIRELNNRQYYEFANYNVVRKLVQGLMDNLDLNMVSDRVVYKAVETEHLKTPDYWLTCVLLAVMAWKSDDRALAERAMMQAIRLDKKNSAVFLMLFNLRMDRSEAALKWFYTYQECPLKGSDQRTFLLLFALMNKTVNSSEHLSDAERAEIQRFIQRVVDANASAQSYTEDDMVRRVQSYYDRMDSKESADYPLLQKYSADYPALHRALMAARGNVGILEFLKRTIHVDSVQRNSFVKSFIDELIAQPNSVEKQVRDDIRYNEMIIQYEGDVERAQQEFSARQVHDETELNLIAEMIDWIFRDDPDELDAQGKLNMLTLTKQLHEKAFERHTQAYRDVEKNTLRVTINDYSGSEDLTRPDTAEEHIRSFYREKKEAALATIKNTGIYVGVGLAAAAAIAAPFLSLSLLFVALACLGFAAVVMLGNKAKRKDLEMQCEKNTQAACEILRKLSQEHALYLEEFGRFDVYTEEIRSEFAEI